MRILNAVASGVIAALAVGGAVSLGAGVAAAVPDVVDRPYSDAKQMIANEGGKAVVATRVGGSADEGDCLVTNAWDAPYQRVVRGGMTTNNEVLVALNCNGALAEAGSPGNSAASPVGRQAKTEAERQAAAQEEQELAQAATPNE